MALGSISFVLALAELPVGMATGISVSYVLLVMLLSWIFLNESVVGIHAAGLIMLLVILHLTGVICTDTELGAECVRECVPSLELSHLHFRLNQELQARREKSGSNLPSSLMVQSFE